MLPRAAAYRRLYCYPATVFALTVSASASSVTSDTQVTALAPHPSPRRTEYLGSRRALYLRYQHQGFTAKTAKSTQRFIGNIDLKR